MAEKKKARNSFSTKIASPLKQKGSFTESGVESFESNIISI